MRRLAAILLFLAGFLPAIAAAQAPPAVPALPDTARLTSYSISAQTGPLAVGFQVYGDSTDYGNWLEVWLCPTTSTCSKLTPVTDWTLSLTSGTLATAARPLTNAQVTLTAPQTGTLEIVGERRPRRIAQFTENKGVTGRDLNVALTDVVAQNRETWDRALRAIVAPPGEVLTALPPAAARSGKLLVFDGSGNPSLTSPVSGIGNVLGPASSTVGHLATWNGTSGTLLADTNSPTGTVKWQGDQFFGSGVPWLDVKSGAHGCAVAAGDGSTDDRAAIQCYIDWAFANLNGGGGVIKLSPGNFRIGSPGLVVKGTVFIQGPGKGNGGLTTGVDTTVVSFDAATCNSGGGMADLSVLGWENASATADAVKVGANCATNISRAIIWGGHHAINTAGIDGTYSDIYACGWTGDNIFSSGANWYFDIKADACANPSTANGFEQVSAVFTENFFYRVDLSCGTCTNSIKIDDTTGSRAVTHFYGAITSKPIVIANALHTAFIGGEIGSTFSGSGLVSIIGVRGSGSAPTGTATYNCAANFSVGCPQTIPGLTVTGSFTATGLVTNADLVNPATTVAGQTCTLGSTCGLSSLNNSVAVAVNLAASYQDGPSVAQGTTGTWFASGNATVTGTANDTITCKLWDGTTLIDSGVVAVSSGGASSLHLSGLLASPAANLRISCFNATAIRGTIATGNGVDAKASTITAFRIN